MPRRGRAGSRTGDLRGELCTGASRSDSARPTPARKPARPRAIRYTEMSFLTGRFQLSRITGAALSLSWGSLRVERSDREVQSC
jgi:hypothetical protein